MGIECYSYARPVVEQRYSAFPFILPKGNVTLVHTRYEPKRLPATRPPGTGIRVRCDTRDATTGMQKILSATRRVIWIKKGVSFKTYTDLSWTARVSAGVEPFAGAIFAIDNQMRLNAIGNYRSISPGDGIDVRRDGMWFPGIRCVNVAGSGR